MVNLMVRLKVQVGLTPVKVTMVDRFFFLDASPISTCLKRFDHVIWIIALTTGECVWFLSFGCLFCWNCHTVGVTLWWLWLFTCRSRICTSDLLWGVRFCRFLSRHRATALSLLIWRFLLLFFIQLFALNRQAILLTILLFLALFFFFHNKKSINDEI